MEERQAAEATRAKELHAAELEAMKLRLAAIEEFVGMVPPSSPPSPSPDPSPPPPPSPWSPAPSPPPSPSTPTVRDCDAVPCVEGHWKFSNGHGCGIVKWFRLPWHTEDAGGRPA
eukprot:scaffold35896_cov39-Phaeocystis_antarctica.AAC.1